MKKQIGLFTVFFFLGFLSPHAATEIRHGFIKYKSASENYLSNRPFDTVKRSESSTETTTTNGREYPADPGAPIGSGLGVIALCSGFYFLFQSRKQKEKTL
jgi:hypothetical protein